LRDSIFNTDKIKQLKDYESNEKLKDQQTIEEQAEYKNMVRFYGLGGGIIALLLLTIILVRSNRNKQRAYGLLQKQKQEIDTQKAKVEKTLDELKTTQAQLIQSEKMASLGEITAGIAHEIQNPLNFINNFAQVNEEFIEEAKDAIKKGQPDEAANILGILTDNQRKINLHGQRADSIVKGMLQHSRTTTGQKELTDINALADEYLRLAYHGFRAKDKSFNATLKSDFGSKGSINTIPQDIGRVLLNLYNNAFYSMSEKKKHAFEGYEPTINLVTRRLNDKVEISVKDNGYGIPSKVIDKIFQPFFTTKLGGQGTGLGLSISYDIIKSLGGRLEVYSKEGEYAEFVIELPV